MHKFEQVILNCAFRFCRLCISKSTCAFLPWSCALYQNYSSLPRRSKLYIACSDFLCKNWSSLMPLLLLFRKRSHSRRLFACKRAHNAFGSLPIFCESACRCRCFYGAAFLKICRCRSIRYVWIFVRHYQFFNSNIVDDIIFI